MSKYKTPRLVALLLFSVLLTACSDGSDSYSNDDQARIELVKGAPMVGGANGMYFDRDDKLYVANVFGQTISKIDPETGEILEQLGSAQGVSFADDLILDMFGTLYWTEPTTGRVLGRSNGEPTFEVATGFPSANPITMGDDGRLFFAQCFETGSNGIFEADPTGVMPPRTIRDGDADCASNGMDWWDGALYAPRWFEGRIVRVDIDTGELTDVTTNWPVPAAVKFNSMGELHAVSQGSGEVVRVDMETGEREVLAVFPRGWLDNLAFDANDRLFVSSAPEGTVVEVLDNGDVREVSPGGMISPMGVTLVGDTVYIAESASFRGFDTTSGEPVSKLLSVHGVGPLHQTSSISSFGEYLLLMSINSNQFLIWDPVTNAPVLETHFLLPFDAEPFGDDLLVVELGAGRVVRAVMPDLATREPVASGFIFPAGLAVHDDDAYVSDAFQGTVFQIIRAGVVLDTPEPVATGLEVPEGITLTQGGTRLLVVEGGPSRLTEVDLRTGAKRTVATDLGFQPQTVDRFITHWMNDVEVDDAGAIYVNSDGDNTIYKLRDLGPDAAQ